MTSKTIIVRSFKLGQLIEDDELITRCSFKKNVILFNEVIAFREKHFVRGHNVSYTSFLIGSPEPLGSQGELIVCSSSRRPSVGVRPPFSKIFSSETAWPNKAKFYKEPP